MVQLGNQASYMGYLFRNRCTSQTVSFIKGNLTGYAECVVAFEDGTTKTEMMDVEDIFIIQRFILNTERKES